MRKRWFRKKKDSVWCFKHPTSIAVPTSPHHRTEPNGPAVLKSVAMKHFETSVGASEDLDDADIMGLHHILQHLDQPKTYVQIL